MEDIQYAEIPLKYLGKLTEPSPSKLRTYFPKNLFKLSKNNPYSELKMESILVEINEEKPYVEELLTKNKIGISKLDGYKIYLKENTIYNKCSKEQAYMKIVEQLNYKEEIKNLFG
ncbi:MAG: hypothetical protein IKF82_03030 [Bacilli bacterium]|nr:hypothetical protein [Bacilli bacterium]